MTWITPICLKSKVIIQLIEDGEQHWRFGTRGRRAARGAAVDASQIHPRCTLNHERGLHVSRNAQLAAQPANPKFIYQVPTVTFPNPAVPLFRIDTAVDLSGLVPGGSLEATLI